MLTMTKYRPWPRHPRYLVGNDGTVIGPKGGVLAHLVNDGYAHFAVRHEGRARRIAVHTAVCETFHGPRPTPDHQVAHGNGVRLDNRASNLRWATRSENELDKVRHGTHHETRKTHCPRGHLLAVPNLRPDRVAQGKRVCLACNRAHGHASYSSAPVDLQAKSDEYYAVIMQAVAS